MSASKYPATGSVPRTLIEMDASTNTIFSVRKARGNKVVFDNIPRHASIPLELRPVGEKPEARSHRLCSVVEGRIYYLTEQRYRRDAGSGEIFEMSPQEENALSLQFNFYPNDAVRFTKAGGGAFTLDTRGYGYSFQPPQDDNRPPLFQYFRYKLIGEYCTIRNLANGRVLTCLGGSAGALVTADQNTGSEKQLWLIDSGQQRVVHKSTGYVLDFAPGQHARLCINPLQPNKASQHWFLSDAFLTCREGNLVGTGHKMTGAVTADAKRPERGDWQKWELTIA